MKRKPALNLIPSILIALVAMSITACQSVSPGRPNVVFILADDLEKDPGEQIM
jgi:hypothetical protein